MPKTEAQTQFSVKLRKPFNSDVRSREYLTESEIKTLLQLARKTGLMRVRNHCLILTMFRHGLRAGEATRLKWSDVDFRAARLNVKRLKRGASGTHPIYGDELRSLRELEKRKRSPYVFELENGLPITYGAIRQVVLKLGKEAGFEFQLHPHMLRHSCGYYLANKGYDLRLIQDWLGHRSVTCTVLYTQLSPSKFEGVFDE